jgi:SAM-dependent methyltransferase
MLLLEDRDRREGTSRAVGEITAALDARADDLVAALSRPSKDERLEFFRRLVESRGFLLAGNTEGQRLGVYLATNLQRVRDEYQAFARELAAARGDAAREMEVRSRLFRARGIALDASLLPNLALEEALRGLTADGTLAAGSVRRVAVVGPGLDFIDKQEGYDFYPPQTIQPFTLVDSLRRLRLAAPTGVEITTLDISDRVTGHIARAAANARAERPYVLQLPRPVGIHWTAEADSYWRQLGDRIGDAVTATPPLDLHDVEVRAVRIRPDVVRKVEPLDLNVVYQRLVLSPERRFDVVVATNVLVYYDTFEQALALANIAAMLRPGGLLLSNSALPEVPVSGMRRAGSYRVRYSDRADDGDHVLIYRRLTSRAETAPSKQ